MTMETADWSLYRDFLAVVERGSLLSAAAALRRDQSSLSRSVAQLESLLGGALFERTGRGMAPTALARALLPAARSMAEAAAAAQALALGQSEAAGGRLRVATSEVAATYLLPPLLARFQREHTSARITLVSSNSVANLLRREADVAVRFVRPDQASVVCKRVAQVGFGLYASAHYLRERGRPTDVASLRDHSLVGEDQDTYIARGLQSFGVDARHLDFVVSTDDQVAYARLVAGGAGIGVLADYVAAQLPGLERVLATEVSVELPLWLVVHRELRGRRLIRQLFDHLARDLPDLLRNLMPPERRAAALPARPTRR